MTDDALEPRPPNRGLPLVVGGVGIAYLLVGAMIVDAYGVANGPTDFVIERDGFATHAPWLIPGLLLIASSPFIRRNPWAVALAFGVFASTAIASVPLVVWELVIRPTWPERAVPEVAIFAFWFAILTWGLRKLRVQWRCVSNASISAFPVLIPGSIAP